MAQKRKPSLRLTPHDEFMHPLEAATNFNESMYFNVFDPARTYGGFFRLGNRANEGHAELTVCIYDADGTVYFQYLKPIIANNDAFDAGGMRFDVVEPFRALDVTYRGKVFALRDPSVMADPKRAFANSPVHDCEVTLRFTGLSPMFGGEPEAESASEPNGFARGHYEQHVRAVGTVRIGARALAIDGFGLRDHSWGPRFWQNPAWYRWLTINFGPDLGAMITVLAGRDGTETRHGTFFHDGRYDAIVDVRLVSHYDPETRAHRALEVLCTTERGDWLVLEGEVIRAIPLRNVRTTPEGETLTTRISEAFTRFRYGERVGYGMSEYLDQIEGGVPIGNAHDAG